MILLQTPRESPFGEPACACQSTRRCSLVFPHFPRYRARICFDSEHKLSSTVLGSVPDTEHHQFYTNSKHSRKHQPCLWVFRDVDHRRHASVILVLFGTGQLETSFANLSSWKQLAKRNFTRISNTRENTNRVYWFSDRNRHRR